MTDESDLLSEARQLMEDEEYDEVLALLDGQASEACLCLRAQALLELEEFEDVLEELAGLEGEPESSEPFTLRGLAHYYLEELQEAQDAFGAAQKLDPTDVAALHGRALVYHALEFSRAANLDLDKAMMVLESADFDPEERSALIGQTHNLRAGFLIEEGEAGAATDALMAAHAADDTEPEYALDVARITMLQGRVDEALDYAGRAVEIDEYCFEARLLQAQLTALSGDSSGALDLVRATVDLDPEEPYSHIMLATVLSLAGRLAEAVEAADTAIELDPELADGYQLKAAALEALGRHGEIDAVIREFLQEAPDLPGYLFGERFDPYEASNQALAELANMSPGDLQNLAKEVMGTFGMPEALRPMIDQVMGNLPAMLEQLSGSGLPPEAPQKSVSGPPALRVIEGGKHDDE
jgi:tetratricopeptide (TPR) repeat protein